MRNGTSNAAPPPPGLRERKKRQTHETIARVALDLFDRQGYQATTIPQIAAAADVSPRTVSVHFPAKEALVFPDEDEWLASLTERVRERPPDETAPEALRAWVGEQQPRWEGRDAEVEAQRRIVARDEGLQAYRRRQLGRVEELMAEEIARDLDTAPDALEPRMAAAATAAILEVLDQHRLEGDLATRQAEALAIVDRAMAFVSGGIRALSADRRAR